MHVDCMPLQGFAAQAARPGARREHGAPLCTLQAGERSGANSQVHVLQRSADRGIDYISLSCSMDPPDSLPCLLRTRMHLVTAPEQDGAYSVRSAIY